MKRFIFAVLAWAFCVSVVAQTAGIVVKADGDCPAGNDKMIFETRSGYVLAEQYSGTFLEGWRVYGSLHSYGFKNVKVNNNDARIYIEDYMASKDKAIEWCFGDED
jgi:hypothetical protein